MRKLNQRPFKFYRPFIIFVLCFLVLLINNVARADYINISLGSRHFTDINKDWNEVNPGLGYVRTLNSNVDAIVGAYHNSLRKTAAYGGIALHTDSDIELGVDLGLVTGYPAPYALSPYVAVGHVKLNFLPIMTKNARFAGYAVGVSLRVEI